MTINTKQIYSSMYKDFHIKVTYIHKIAQNCLQFHRIKFYSVVKYHYNYSAWYEYNKHICYHNKFLNKIILSLSDNIFKWYVLQNILHVFCKIFFTMFSNFEVFISAMHWLQLKHGMAKNDINLFLEFEKIHIKANKYHLL